ncbi:hypothetical protein TVAG_038460 [Trichomonas vaginalis G3]|uniref:Uncharacterized protein n=1 Tax=Trichomonas vaginalis (strain ATCC PRA-98 / G3) TaxID=412133 RepID=A2DY02_TRIV3|nr:hypothetical protein TVAGG3_0960810 [Trichomonas vaginalis G3]EAY14738.1 hypothetical protein TVAG_038460 [Trichomonas vaginalis G3]KAI5487891.1 hypothetical protein TVAGG3_0960810 [Trichomonas vaginalis G3]|eukprot:XP_001326961.1 hypothetical protein [Trichomonas vaginalis G3]
MWGLLKKAGEYIAPMIAVDSLQDVKEACDHCLGVLNGTISENELTFDSALASIKDYLTEEVGQPDMPYFDYVTSQLFIQKIAESLGPKLTAQQIESILLFFLAFANTKLGNYFAQITVHRPFSLVVSKLESVYAKTPGVVEEFIKGVWGQCKKSPLMLEMITIPSSQGISYPLLDFLAIAAFNPDEIGMHSREAILYIFSTADDPEIKIHESIPQYLLKQLEGSIESYLKNVCECVPTIQFSGSSTVLLSWIDQLIIRTNTVDIQSILSHVKSLDITRRLGSLALLLNFFINKVISEAVIKEVQSKETIDLIVSALDSKNDDSIKSSLLLIKSMLLNNETIAYIIPPTKDERIDVLSFMPPSWLIEIDGSSSISAYEADAVNRINIISHVQGKNNDLFPHVAALLKNAKTMPLRELLSLTSVLSLFTAAESSLIGSCLAENFEAAVNQLSEVQIFELPSENSKDGPEVRAAILAEFGKEIHATFTAHEKFNSVKKAFDDE